MLTFYDPTFNIRMKQRNYDDVSRPSESYIVRFKYRKLVRVSWPSGLEFKFCWLSHPSVGLDPGCDTCVLEQETLL